MLNNEPTFDRIAQQIEFARHYVEHYNHGADGHISMHAINYLANQVHMLQRRIAELSKDLEILRAPVELEAIVTDLTVSTDTMDIGSYLSPFKTIVNNGSRVEITLESTSPAKFTDMFNRNAKLYVQIRELTPDVYLKPRRNVEAEYVAPPEDFNEFQRKVKSRYGA